MAARWAAGGDGSAGAGRLGSRVDSRAAVSGKLSRAGAPEAVGAAGRLGGGPAPGSEGGGREIRRDTRDRERSRDGLSNLALGVALAPRPDRAFFTARAGGAPDLARRDGAARNGRFGAGFVRSLWVGRRFFVVFRKAAGLAATRTVLMRLRPGRAGLDLEDASVRLATFARALRRTVGLRARVFFFGFMSLVLTQGPSAAVELSALRV